MALKKQQYSDEEIAIFDEAVIYKRGAYWHFRMWLKGEGKYARKSLRTRSKATAVEKGKAAYLEIYANLQQGKTYFSITTKEGVAKYLEHRLKDVESGLIVVGRHTTIKTHLQHWLEFIGKDTKLKELERTDAETKLVALELIMGTSQSVVAMARKLTMPKAKTRTVIVPKEKVIKAEPRQRKVSKKDDEPRSLEPIKPKPPLPNQRIGEERI